MSKTNKEIAEAKSTAIGQVLDFSDDAGAGLEGTDKNSFAIPFLTILQGLSPQLETVEGARPGLFINTITNELFKEVLVIPCAYQRRYIRWSPRSSGGGYKGEYNPVEVETGNLQGLTELNGIRMMDVPEGVTKLFDDKGLPLYDHLQDTRNHFVLAMSETGAWQPALISLSSSQIKKSKRWMSRIQGIEMRNAQGKAFTPPSFSHIYKMVAVKEKNAKGEWWGVDFDLVEPVQDVQLYANAKAFHASVADGSVQVTPPADQVIEGDEVNKF